MQKMEDVEELIWPPWIDYNTAISTRVSRATTVWRPAASMENAGNASGLEPCPPSRPGSRRRRQRRPDERDAPAGSHHTAAAATQGITVTMPIVIYGRAWQADGS